MSGSPSAVDQGPRALLINGTVGVGKSSAADAIGALLTAAEIPHAVIDVDALRHAWPAPSDDPFHLELTLANLAAVSHNFVAAGSRRLILAGVVETSDERVRYEAALRVPLTLVRLRVEPAVIRRRLALRHRDDLRARMWHLARLSELDAVLEAAAIDDHVLDVTEWSREAIATTVLRQVDWLG